MTSTHRKGRTQASVGRAVRVSTGEDTSQLLEMAFGLHQAGERGRARGLYERIIEQDPEHADALHFLGLACFQDGEAERAAGLIRRAIAVRPQVAPYHDNLGAVLESTGTLVEALEAYEEAARLAGDDAERSFNMGVVLHRLGRLAEAEQAYRSALAGAPADGGFHYNLANLLKDQNRLLEAVDHYRLAIEHAPGFADARNNLGNALQALGRFDEAVEAYEAAVALRPEDAATLTNLANAHRRRGHLESAAEAYGRALVQDPAHGAAGRGLGEVRHAQGRFDAALAAYEALLERDPGDQSALAGLAAALRFVPAAAAHPRMRDYMERCFALPHIQAQDLAAATATLLLGEHRLDAAGTDMKSLVERLGTDSLMLALLTRTINVDPAMERFLTDARSHLLLGGEEACRSEASLRLATAIATQCFINEFVFALGPEARAAALDLCDRLARDLRTAHGPDDGLRARCALLAMAQPLLGVDGGDELARWGRDAWGEVLWPLIERAVCEPLEERVLADAIATAGTVEDQTSEAVRAQYEQHPYPRWLELPRREPVSYAAYLARRFPGLEPPAFLDGPLDVLCAGCGTGHEALAIATGRSGCRVLGLDLSRRSLAYAQRMASKLGVREVEFVQGDILHVGRLGRCFHVIETTGVLHHMADPIEGWRALRDCLEPGGLMRVGLYSEHARGEVIAARERIRERGLSPTDEDIRDFRAEILAAPRSSPLAGLADSEDLYTLSACRDLLFHVEEHRFTIPAIAEALDALELDFVGFDPPVAGILHDFRAQNPHDGALTDLSAWRRFEEARPDLFAALYVFWCQRRR